MNIWVSTSNWKDKIKIVKTKYFKGIFGCQVFWKDLSAKAIPVHWLRLWPDHLQVLLVFIMYDSGTAQLFYISKQRDLRTKSPQKYSPPIRDKNLFLCLFHRICHIFKISFGINVPEKQGFLFVCFIYFCCTERKKKQTYLTAKWKMKPLPEFLQSYQLTLHN